MKENKYDDAVFFEKYGALPRSLGGLEAAGEWPALQKLLPDFAGKRVLDLGCGYGWHCRHAIANHAKMVVGLDISEMMLEKAIAMTDRNAAIEYIRRPIEEAEFADASFDMAISSLALHYIQSYDALIAKIFRWLDTNGTFTFSVEHPVFTASGKQDWIYSDKKEKLHWPVDNYFYEGRRDAVFLGENIVKYHRTVTTYVQELLKHGFTITNVVEPAPEQNTEEMKNEFRRPMMLLVSARKA
jgi:ubiquinone/menaquinone biosynthesis C-methylase UbiE